MAQSATLSRVFEELDRELAIYRGLAGMLEEQYLVATRLDTSAMVRISDAIAREVRALDANGSARHPRLLDVVALICRRGNDTSVSPQLDASQHAQLEARCRELRQLAVQCKALTVRNGNLLASQFEGMHQVLHGETHTYAPG